jgi:predicted RNase H-like HicB family nuclease
VRYLTLSKALELHRQVIGQSGGALGVLDLGALESALAHPRLTFGGRDLYPSVVDKAAALGYSRAAERRKIRHMNFRVEIEQEEDGRWIAEVVDLPGVLAYGSTSEEAKAKIQALALRVVADRLEHGEAGTDLVSISFAAV